MGGSKFQQSAPDFGRFRRLQHHVTARGHEGEFRKIDISVSSVQIHPDEGKFPGKFLRRFAQFVEVFRLGDLRFAVQMVLEGYGKMIEIHIEKIQINVGIPFLVGIRHVQKLRDPGKTVELVGVVDMIQKLLDDGVIGGGR